ncbi:MAG: hypothetical protein CMM50_14135 [Rhodospirillaceae bacterium]|nr:hypothetical protein [Rhodospirillaceae bacterium]
MAEAGREIAECYRVLEKGGSNVVAEILRGQGTFYEWNHYPDGDVYDGESHGQFYYHAHPSPLRESEHGHFHTFLRVAGMAPGTEPVPMPATVERPEGGDALSHLIGISMDRRGYPTRLFTTNRWVTGETWYDARDVTGMLDRFVIDHASPSWPTNRWISAMIRLFKPQIVRLLEERDAAVALWQKGHPDEVVYEDRNLEVTSSMPISVDVQVKNISTALRRLR